MGVSSEFCQVQRTQIALKCYLGVSKLGLQSDTNPLGCLLQEF